MKETGNTRASLMDANTGALRDLGGIVLANIYTAATGHVH